jgi:hypothetical protein
MGNEVEFVMPMGITFPYRIEGNRLVGLGNAAMVSHFGEEIWAKSAK